MPRLLRFKYICDNQSCSGYLDTVPSPDGTNCMLCGLPQKRVRDREQENYYAREMNLEEATSKLWARLPIMGDCEPIECNPKAGTMAMLLVSGFQEAIVEITVKVVE